MFLCGEKNFFFAWWRQHVFLLFNPNYFFDINVRVLFFVYPELWRTLSFTSLERIHFCFFFFFSWLLILHLLRNWILFDTSDRSLCTMHICLIIVRRYRIADIQKYRIPCCLSAFLMFTSHPFDLVPWKLFECLFMLQWYSWIKNTEKFASCYCTFQILSKK